MNQVIAWAAFLGAWLLVAGPLYQGAIELHEEDIDRDAIDAALAQLTQAQREQFTSFVNKATGWFTVAIGASLLAAGQTWQVIERYHWPAWLFWLLILVMLGASVLNTALRMSHDARTARSAARQVEEDWSPLA